MACDTTILSGSPYLSPDYVWLFTNFMDVGSDNKVVLQLSKQYRYREAKEPLIYNAFHNF